MKDLLSKCDQIRSFLRIWSHLPKKSLVESLIFCAVKKRDIAITTKANKRTVIVDTEQSLPHPDVFCYSLNGIGAQKMCPKKFCNIFSYIFYVKTK